MRPRQEFLHVQHQETLLFFPPSSSFRPKLCIRTRSVGSLDTRITTSYQASSSPLRNKGVLDTSSYLVPPPPRLLLIWAVGFSVPPQSFRDCPLQTHCRLAGVGRHRGVAVVLEPQPGLAYCNVDWGDVGAKGHLAPVFFQFKSRKFQGLQDDPRQGWTSALIWVTCSQPQVTQSVSGFFLNAFPNPLFIQQRQQRGRRGPSGTTRTN